jgi:hypothetical protein
MSADHIRVDAAQVNAADEIFSSKGVVAEFVPKLKMVGLNIVGTQYILFDPDQATHANGSGVRYENLGNGPARGSLSRVLARALAKALSSEKYNEIVSIGREAKREYRIGTVVAAAKARPA